MMTRAAEYLLGCPFCGERPQWVKEAVPGIATSPFLACTNDDCFGPRTTAIGEDAIVQWNTRAGPSPSDLAQVRAALEPFAEVANSFDADGRTLKDTDGIYANLAGDFRRAREALAILERAGV